MITPMYCAFDDMELAFRIQNSNSYIYMYMRVHFGG